MADEPDPRTTPMRGGVAAAKLRGRVEAETFVDGDARCVTADHADLVLHPGDTALATQLLHGEPFTVFGGGPGGLVWGQGGWDGYVGYVAASALGEAGEKTTAMVSTGFAPVYPAPDMKSRPIRSLPLGSRVVAGEADGGFVAAAGGFIHTRNIAPVDEPFAATARRFFGVAYLWGGRTAAGLDCSALVQLCAMAMGLDCPRDSDMQWRDFGTALGPDTRSEPGDLAFWHGHVGIMLDGETLIHANAHHMAVDVEPLGRARARLAAADVAFLGLKRPEGPPRSR